MTKIAYKKEVRRNYKGKYFAYKCPHCRKEFVAEEGVIDGEYYTCPNCRGLVKIGGWLV
jgi:DNA-directed RNA polymerase subunit RPC12/RpoP